jgi:hypothetical protein
MAPATQDSSTSLTRAPQHLADRLHLVELERVAPGHALPHAGLALEPGARVVGHQRDGRQIAHRLVAEPRHVHRTVHRVLGRDQQVQALAHALAGQLHGLDRHVGQRFEQQFEDPVVLALVRVLGWRLGLALGRRRAAVGDGQHHGDQRDAVGDAVVDAADQHAAAVEVLDQLHMPQRVARDRAAPR